MHGDFPNVNYFLRLTFSESNACVGKSDNFHLPDEVQLFSNGRPDLYFSGRFVKFSEALVKTFPMIISGWEFQLRDGQNCFSG